MMKKLWMLVFVLSLMPVSGWAADTGSETLYVRPTAACANNGDGTAYGCAASAGVVGAYKGFSNVLFNAANTAGQVDIGDTLYICGAHTTVFLTGVSGTSANHIIARGDCPADAGSIDIAGSDYAPVKQRDDTPGEDYWEIKYLTLAGGTSAAIHCNGSGSICRGNIYEYNTITTYTGASTHGIDMRGPRDMIVRYNTVNGVSGAGGGGILADRSVSCAAPTCSNNLIQYNTVYGHKAWGIRVSGPGGTSLLEDFGIVEYNTVYDNGDGIYHVLAPGVITRFNTVYSNRRTTGTGEGSGLASTWSDRGTWQGNVVYDNRVKGIEVYNDNVVAPFLYTYIISNTFYGNTDTIGGFLCAIDVNNNAAGVNLPNSYVIGNIVSGSECGINMAVGVTGVVANNTVVDPRTNAAIYTEPNAANIAIVNNVISSGSIRGIWNQEPNGVGMVISNNYFNTTSAATMIRYNAVDYTSATVTTIDANAKVEASAFIGAASRDYRLPASSLNRRTGITGYSCKDVRGRACYPDRPDIGAYQASSGDPANTRTAR